MATSSETRFRRPGRLTAAGVVILIALALLWPALVNGGPFFMADTPSYVRAAASGLFKLFGVKTAWTHEYLRIYASAPDVSAHAAASAPAGAGQIPVTLSGRSIFYGTFVYLSQLAGSLWIVVAVQSLLSAVCILLTVTALGRASGVELRPSITLLIGLVAAVATPLGFFSGYLMPDVFGGFALLAVGNLLFLWQWQSRSVKAFWFALLAYSLVVHSVNLMLVIALLAACLIYAWARSVRLSRESVIGIVACVAGALVAQTGFKQAVNAMTGAPPVSPPFVAMRLIADGPGYAYLADHCPKERHFYCPALRQHDPSSDTLLWSNDPHVSLFRGLTPNEQRRSSAEQRQFILDVVKERPGEVTAGAVRNSFGQLIRFDLNGFNYNPENRARFHSAIPAQIMEVVTPTRAYRNIMPTTPVEVATVVIVALSLIGIVGLLASRRLLRDEHLRAYCLCLIAGLLINAALCGALSGPKGRYEMRLIWVLPVIALALGSAALQRRRNTELEAVPAA